MMEKTDLTIPLFNFELVDIEACELGTDRIEKAQAHEAEKIENDIYYGFNLKVLPESQEEQRDAFDRALITLKLFKDEFIFGNFFKLPDSLKM